MKKVKDMSMEELIAHVIGLRAIVGRMKNLRRADEVTLNFYIRTNKMLKNRLEAWEKSSNKRTYKNIQTVKEKERKMKLDIRVLRRENG